MLAAEGEALAVLLRLDRELAADRVLDLEDRGVEARGGEGTLGKLGWGNGRVRRTYST